MGGGNSTLQTEYYDVTLYKLWDTIRNPLILDRNIDDDIYTVNQQFTLSTYLPNKDHSEPKLFIAQDETLDVPVGSSLFIDINVINNGIINIHGDCASNTQSKGAYITVGGQKQVTLTNNNTTSSIRIGIGSLLEFNNASFILNETTLYLGGTLFLNNSEFSDTNAVLNGVTIRDRDEPYYGKVYTNGIQFYLGQYNRGTLNCS